jgi:hypothetical protein
MTSPTTLFEWLNEITVTKTPTENFSEESWDKFNSYMVHRYLSMYIGYIDIVNYVQKINPTNKKQIYSIYREMIPKQKVWLKYIKSQTPKKNAELVEYVADYFECSLGEADHYIDILRETGVRSILWKMGIDEKEQNKLVKSL